MHLLHYGIIAIFILKTSSVNTFFSLLHRTRVGLIFQPLYPFPCWTQPQLLCESSMAWFSNCAKTMQLCTKNTLHTFYIMHLTPEGANQHMPKKKKLRKIMQMTCQLNSVSVFSFIRQPNYLKPPHPCHSHSPCTGTSTSKIRLFQSRLI